MPQAEPLKISLVSLGCPKNLVDSENMLGLLAQEGYEIVEENEDADIIIVNTCAFILPAEEEAVDALLDLSDLKTEGRARVLLCAGCLPQRRGRELLELLPEVDGFLSVGAIQRLPEAIQRALAGEKVFFEADFEYTPTAASPRWRSAPPWSAYIKIADGCSNYCTYCTIPDIRGPYRSRTIDDVVAEFQQLVASGVREVCLIAQDTTAYGQDLPGQQGLADLLAALAEVPFAGWIRLLYMHPEHLDERVLHVMGSSASIVNYIDIPLQHVAASVLQRMGRQGSKQEYLELVTKMRRIMPGVAIRTTFMTGFPGETEEEFEDLLDFMAQARLDRVSAFRYWPEEGTPSATMPSQVSEEVRDERLSRLLAVQEMISLEVNQQFVGQQLTVLLEECVEGIWKGRTYRDAPEVDGEVKLTTGSCAGATLEPGEFVQVQIVRAEVHDLEGDLVT